MSKDKENKKTVKSKRVSVKKLKEDIQQLEQKILHKTADFENYRRRIQRELNDTREHSKLNVIEQVLNIYDIFKMALQASEQENADLQVLLQGLTLIKAEFTKVLEEYSVVEFNCVGKEFNHNIHEAMSEEFSDEHPKGIIIKQLRCGYKAGEKLIRVASVVVSKGKETPEKEVPNNNE